MKSTGADRCVCGSDFQTVQLKPHQPYAFNKAQLCPDCGRVKRSESAGVAQYERDLPESKCSCSSGTTNLRTWWTRLRSIGKSLLNRQ